MRSFRSVFITIVALAGIATAPRMSAAPEPVSCDTAAMPAQVREMLRNKFAGWRPKQLSDMSVEDQKSWLASPSGKFCPGIAIGHFENSKDLSYAVLLLHKSEPTHGYKIIVFSKQADGDIYTSNLLELSDSEPDSALVISKVAPGKFPDLETEKSVRTTLDGVIVESLEKGAVLYYWSESHCRRIIISD
ncbi:MAG TPA: hypothetical protein VGJ06_01245 [Candidatus Acidoferrum sp.]